MAARTKFVKNDGLTAAVRASVHYFNTEEEIDRLIAVIAGGGNQR
jgi:selenocysteine lyase/cysteine desulfurase